MQCCNTWVPVYSKSHNNKQDILHDFPFAIRTGARSLLSRRETPVSLVEVRNARRQVCFLFLCYLADNCLEAIRPYRTETERWHMDTWLFHRASPTHSLPNTSPQSLP